MIKKILKKISASVLFQAVPYTPQYLTSAGDNPFSLVTYIFNFALGAIGVVALGAIVYGAILRITSAGNPGKIQESNSWIIGALAGIVLLFGSYILFTTIDPNIVNLPAVQNKIEGALETGFEFPTEP